MARTDVNLPIRRLWHKWDVSSNWMTFIPSTNTICTTNKSLDIREKPLHAITKTKRYRFSGVTLNFVECASPITFMEKMFL